MASSKSVGFTPDVAERVQRPRTIPSARTENDINIRPSLDLAVGTLSLLLHSMLDIRYSLLNGAVNAELW